MNDVGKNEKTKLPKDFHLTDDFSVPTFEEWKEKVEMDLKGVLFEKLITKTIEGINLNPIYTQKDLANKKLHQFPQAGSTRGTNPTGYFNSDWLINQKIDLAEANEFNRALKDALSRGQNSIYITLDKASKLGLDADYADAEEVGKEGLSLSGLNSFSRALNEIDITKYPLFIESGFSSVPFLSILFAYCKKNNIDISKISGVVTADPIGYLVAEGELPVPINSAIAGIKKSLEWTKVNAPLIKTCNITTLPYVNNGANAVQELAFMLATGAEYLRKLIDLGTDINDAAQNILVTLGIGSSFFTEVAKFRAAKPLWKNLIAAFGGDEVSQSIDLFAVSSQFNKTLFDPYVNMLRTTTEAFAAIVGGIKGLQTSPFDSVFSVPNDFSRRIARNTQIILKEEAHFSTPIDPAGGSYFVENLTEELAINAWEKFQEIEKIGGMIEALKTNFIQDDVENIYRQRARLIAKRKSVIVGTNMYANPKEELLETKKINYTELQKKRAEFLQKFRVSKSKENNDKIISALEKLSQECNHESIDIASDAILNGATLGEISSACRVSVSDFEKIKISPMAKRRAAEPFEKLRSRAIEIAQKTGKKPTVFLAPIGTIKEYKGRADFSRNFFEVGGFEIIYPNGFTDYETAVTDAIESKSKIVVICSTDEKYPEIIPQLVSKLKKQSSDITVVLAGYPKKQIEEHKKNGVDEFIFLGADAHSLLSKLLNRYELNK